jgi:hypothetical protein
MSLFSQTLVLYLVVGFGMAGAVYMSDSRVRARDRWFQVIAAILFWPVFLPVLLTPSATMPAEMPAPAQTGKGDEMAAAIRQVDAELEAALGSLDGWAEDVLARETSRIHELRLAWTAQADRIREMDRLLAAPEHTVADLDSPPALNAGQGESSATADRLRSSWQARRQNIDRLGRIRRRAYEDLMGTLAWVRELVSMIHLAKFTGAPAARAEELVAQIAAAVEGLSELTWQEESHVSAGGNT